MDILQNPKLFNQLVWKESPLLWAIDNKILNEKGIQLEFKNHRFLTQIYDDWTPIQVIRKASQVGFSLMEVLKTFNAAKYRKFNIIYTLPTASDVGQFVPSKVNSMISQNPILQQWTQDKDTIFQKKVGMGFIYYRGTATGKTEAEKMESAVGTMFSADILCADECDRSDQEILEQYNSRLASSEYQGKWYFSNPTSPHTLSQKLWEQSDQKHWFVGCEHCGLWQWLDFWKNVKDNKYVCQKCGQEISDEVRRNGKWIKKYRDKDISGYWISHLICPWISAQKIQEEYETKTKQYFYNFVLGLPYIGSDVIVNRDIILRNIDLSEPNFQEHNVLGVDQGLKKHFVLGNRQGIFKIGCVDKWEDIENLIKVYDIELAVFDALPDLTEPRKIREKYPGIVWLNYYRKEIKKADFIKWDYKTHTVYSDRTKIIQLQLDDLINRKIRFNLKAEELTDFIKHYESLYKIIEKDSLGIERDSWETSGADHYVHATNYFRIALEKTVEQTQIKSWTPDKVIDPNIAPKIGQ